MEGRDTMLGKVRPMARCNHYGMSGVRASRYLVSLAIWLGGHEIHVEGKKTLTGDWG